MSRAPKTPSAAPSKAEAPAAPEAAPARAQVQFGPTPSAPGSRLKGPKKP